MPGVLRDAAGQLILDFQRPDDPLDVHSELAELIIARDEAPGWVCGEFFFFCAGATGAGGGGRCGRGSGHAHQAESGFHARALHGACQGGVVTWFWLPSAAQAMVWDFGELVLPLDLRPLVSDGQLKAA